MIDWTSNVGKEALTIIRDQSKKGSSYKQIALLINERKMFKEIVTSEQVRGAKRYHLDREPRKQLANKAVPVNVDKNLGLSTETRKIVEMFQTHIPVIKGKPLKLYADKKAGVTTRTEEMVLMLSGCNVGSDRLKEITKEVKRLHYKQTAASRIDNLNIFMLGDMVLNIQEITKDSYESKVTVELIDRMYVAVSCYAEMLINLLMSFKKIHISAVSNIGTRQGVHWDMLFYKALEKMLANYNDRIVFNISQHNWCIRSVYGQTFLLLHESEILENSQNVMRYYSGKAFYLLNELDTHLNKKKVQYICTADHHESLNNSGIKEHFKNGNTINELDNIYWDDYQYLFGVDCEGVSWRYKI